ncbi:EAL domain-containing protein [Arsenicicoccus sp. oral taxon 190]|uniref:EAL domain-containing protein n=1 Tax=Arsenicicoccus sp. oral taxon 190 TaxID=1658671 RepID=UPI00067A25D5|nr:EAL domain-containing protein [Arsenicicoccus sp. oral taxon 190]AKT50248.1 hypothetical protein ADJ73_00970 [Arsenicicoccus sp. oral taxon 190]
MAESRQQEEYFRSLVQDPQNVTRLTEWVLSGTVTSLRRLGPGGIPVSVNLPTALLDVDDVAPRLKEMLRRGGLRPTDVHLELAEAAWVERLGVPLAQGFWYARPAGGRTPRGPARARVVGILHGRRRRPAYGTVAICTRVCRVLIMYLALSYRE